jgi:hypothetical protein
MFDFQKIKNKIEEDLLTRSQIQSILDQATFLKLDLDQINYLEVSLHKIQERVYFVDEKGNVEIKKIDRGQTVNAEPPKVKFDWLGHDSESMRLAISEFLKKPKSELPDLSWDFEAFNSQRNYHFIADSYLKILKYLYKSEFEKPKKVVFHSFFRCSIFYSNNGVSHAEISSDKISFIHNIEDKTHLFCIRCDTHFEVPFLTHIVNKMCPCCGKHIQKLFETFEFHFEDEKIIKIEVK